MIIGSFKKYAASDKIILHSFLANFLQMRDRGHSLSDHYLYTRTHANIKFRCSAYSSVKTNVTLLMSGSTGSKNDKIYTYTLRCYWTVLPSGKFYKLLPLTHLNVSNTWKSFMSEQLFDEKSRTTFINIFHVFSRWRLEIYVNYNHEVLDTSQQYWERCIYIYIYYTKWT